MSTLLRPGHWLPLAGLVAALALWWAAVTIGGRDNFMLARFAPAETWQAILEMVRDGGILDHARASLQRVGLGLLFALSVGVPLGLLVGFSPAFNQATSVVFQFLRMTSPLSWMPVAVMLLGVGNAPVVFLVAFAAVWPIMINVASGVRAIDPLWHSLADSMAATAWERLWHVTLPAIASHLLAGVRIAIGLIWVVLVPAEMLGVQSGLGYFVLDTRDRMAYGELMASILLIGLLGFTLDWLVCRLHSHWSGA